MHTHELLLPVKNPQPKMAFGRSEIRIELPSHILVIISKQEIFLIINLCLVRYVSFGVAYASSTVVARCAANLAPRKGRGKQDEHEFLKRGPGEEGDCDSKSIRHLSGQDELKMLWFTSTASIVGTRKPLVAVTFTTPYLT
jgi:hypothetical protein